MSVQYYPGYSQVTVAENLKVKTISSVTQAYPAVLTTSSNHGYPIGVMVTFLIPNNFGMVQLNGRNVQVIDATANTLTLNIDTRAFTPFAAPSPLPNAYTNPSVIPNSSGMYLPPLPLPYGNEDSFQGAIFNNGQPANPINGVIS